MAHARTRRTTRRWGRILTISLVLLLMTLTMAACGGDEADEPIAEPTIEAPVVEEPIVEEPVVEEPVTGEMGEVSLDELIDNMATYLGQTVTTEGAINVVLDEQTFTIASDTFTDDDEMLVVGASPMELDAATSLEMVDKVQVTGQYVEFVLVDVEEAMGLDLDDDLYLEFEGRPAIIASEMTPLAVMDADVVGVDNYFTLDTILDNPENYYGVSMQGNAEIGAIVSDQAFTVEDDDFIGEDALPVLSRDPINLLGLTEDDGVHLRGTLREFIIADIEEEFGWDLDDELYVDWESRPVFIARSVRRLEPMDGAEMEPMDEDAAIVDEDDYFLLDTIIDEPERFYGDTIAGRAEIGTLWADNYSFTIEDADLGPEEELLVLSPNDLLPLGLTEEDDVAVQGTLRPFLIAEVEEEFDLDLDDDLYIDWEERPVLIADSVEAVAPMADEADMDADMDAMAEMERLNVTLDAILDDPDSYYGQSIAGRAEIGEFIDADAFTIEDNDLGPEEELLVLNADPSLDMIGSLALTEDDDVYVRGTLRQFLIADIEEEFGFDLDDTLYVDWEARPVLIARRIAAAEPMAMDAMDGYTLEDITDDPMAFAGQFVVVNGEMNVVLGPGAFTIASEDLTDNNEILVIDATPFAYTAEMWEEMDDLTVAGEVVTFVRADIERDYDLLLDDDFYVDFEGKPAIIATSILNVE